MNDSVIGKKSSPPENDTNESTEHNIDQNSSDAYEDKSLKFYSCMSNAPEFDNSAHLAQVIKKINKNGGKEGKQFYKICTTSSPLSFDKNISEVHNYFEKFDQSSIYSTASDTEICTKEINISEKVPNVLSQAALLEIERLREEFNQQFLALRQEFMSKNEDKLSNGMNDVRSVSGTTYWGGGKSSSNAGVGSFAEESEIRQLAECKAIIENTPILRGSLAVNARRALCENKANLQDVSAGVAGSVEHCNNQQETEKQLDSQRNEYLQNEISAEIEHLRNSLDVEIKQRRETEGKLKLALEELDNYKASTLTAIDRNCVQPISAQKPVKEKKILVFTNPNTKQTIEWMEKATSDIVKICDKKHAVIDNDTAKEEPLVTAVIESAERNALKSNDDIKFEAIEPDLRNSLDAEIKQRRETEGKLKLAQKNSVELRRYKALVQRQNEIIQSINLEDLQRKVSKSSFAISDVVIVKSEMSSKMRNHAIKVMLDSMKECTCATDITKFISGKMREKYGTEWICFISDGKPTPIVLDNKYFLSVYLKTDIIYIELIS